MTTHLIDMMNEVHKVNVDKGWFDDERTFGDMIALLHSEASECLEAYRDHKLEDATALSEHSDHDDYLPKPEGIGSEMADVLIRLLDMAYRYSIDLQYEYDRKVAYNRTRPYRHGNRVL